MTLNRKFEIMTDVQETLATGTLERKIREVFTHEYNQHKGSLADVIDTVRAQIDHEGPMVEEIIERCVDDILPPGFGVGT